MNPTPMIRSLSFILLLSLSACGPRFVAVSDSAPPAEPTVEPAPEDIPPGPPVAVEATAWLQAGPMLGYATHREATVWIQTAGPAEVQVRYEPIRMSGDSIGVAPKSGQTSVLTTSDATDHIALFRIAGLEPGTQYAYDVLVDGVPVAEMLPFAFETQPLWQWRTDPPSFTAAVGSCSYVNDPPYDRPGDGYGGDYRIFESIRALDPDLMLWTGDNIYLREVDWWSEAGIRYRYAHTRGLTEMQGLLANQPNYATWDDHDFGPNNSDRSYVLKGEVLEAFTDYWANPTYGLPDVPGVFGQFQWADVDFFLLDDRYHRTPSSLVETEPRSILGEAQLTWLLDALVASRAPFKVVVMGGQILNPIPIYESYTNVAPEERERLIDGIVERRIEGVVFLSGDRHHTELIEVQPEGFYPLYDFTSSPLTAGAATPRREMDNPDRVPGTLVYGQRNFGTMTFTGPRTDRTLTMRTYDTDGELLWTHAVRAADLRLPRDDR